MQNRNCNQEMRMERSCNPPGNISMFDLQELPVGMAYVPWQYFDTVYDVDKALNCGTIFPELNKPFFGKRGVRG